MTDFIVRYKRLGSHVHVRLFGAKNPDVTHGKNGDLCFSDDEEWSSFLRCFQGRGADTIRVLPEDE